MPVLHLNVRLHRGEFALAISETLSMTGVVGVLGTNGAGKTSLLRLLAGLEASAEGQIKLGDACWQDTDQGCWVPAHQRRVGVVFQDARLFPHLTVAGNLDFAGRRSQGTRLSRAEVVAALALDGLLARQPDQLSGGERQRVALARALMSAPQLLLLDEPLSAADMGQRGELLPYLRRVIDRFSIPTLYVAHALDELTQLADHLLVMRQGRCVARGPVSEVMSRLDLPEVSGADQASSILDARVEQGFDDDGLTRVALGDQFLSLAASNLIAGAPVRIRVYSADVAVATQRPVGISIRNILTAEVQAIHTGTTDPFAEVLLRVGEQKLRARLTRAAVTELGLVPHQSVFALLKTASLVRQ